MAGEHLLIIEDEEDILELLRYNLSRNGYRLTCVTTGEEGLARARSKSPDLIVLDLMLPGLDGLEICKSLKRDPKTEGIPLIMLTARSEEADVVTGLELGADDYVTKPFSIRVLLARIKVVIRRHDAAASDPHEVVSVHGIVLDPQRHKVTVNGEPVELTYTEFRVLHLLAGRPGWVFSRDRIVELLHGDNYAVTARSVDVQIVGLRKRLGTAGKCIETVRGVGYRFKEEA